jgi:hypothetical protein
VYVRRTVFNDATALLRSLAACELVANRMGICLTGQRIGGGPRVLPPIRNYTILNLPGIESEHGHVRSEVLEFHLGVRCQVSEVTLFDPLH